ncbi:MAG: tRNA (adenosine(37)-N6)-threonylcarbamoyltransferase complex transferase subunit TsaD [Candidatus Taylorbacteria bacterium]
MIILGIETSCDDTALALIETEGTGLNTRCRVIASLVHSQADLHSAYGGVFPTLAKREHGKNIVPLLHKLFTDIEPGTVCVSLEHFTKTLDSFKSLQETNPDLYESVIHAEFLKNIPRIDRIAVTEGPGLEPALWVGISFARILGSLWNIPLIPVNHMEGHVIGSLLTSDTAMGTWQILKPVHFPALALLISGGHTELVTIDEQLKYSIIGQTKDDAVGEAFDKVARLLGLPYPGGPHISKLAHEAWEQKIPSPVSLPRPMIGSKDLNFSFSGLKTAVLYAVRAGSDASGVLSDDFKKGLAHEFEQAVTETLEAKLRKAIDETGAETLIIGGGVSANHVLRHRFQAVADEYAIPLYMPTRHISGDNALMIALAGSLHTTDTPRALKADGTKRLDK